MFLAKDILGRSTPPAMTWDHPVWKLSVSVCGGGLHRALGPPLLRWLRREAMPLTPSPPGKLTGQGSGDLTAHYCLGSASVDYWLPERGLQVFSRPAKSRKWLISPKVFFSEQGFDLPSFLICITVGWFLAQMLYFSQTKVLIDQAAALFWSGSNFTDQAATWFWSCSGLTDQAATWFSYFLILNSLTCPANEEAPLGKERPRERYGSYRLYILSCSSSSFKKNYVVCLIAWLLEQD